MISSYSSSSSASSSGLSDSFQDLAQSSHSGSSHHHHPFNNNNRYGSLSRATSQFELDYREQENCLNKLKNIHTDTLLGHVTFYTNSWFYDCEKESHKLNISQFKNRGNNLSEIGRRVFDRNDLWVNASSIMLYVLTIVKQHRHS